MTSSIVAARAFLEEYWDLQIPISPEFFAEKLGLRVTTSDTMGMKSGYLDAERKTICVNAMLVEERRRFAVAHELGHFCLRHGSSLRDTSAADWFRIDPEHDRAADRFAAELLMPAIAVKAMVEVRKVKDPVALRRAFGVSSQALYCRLEELGYFL